MKESLKQLTLNPNDRKTLKTQDLKRSEMKNKLSKIQKKSKAVQKIILSI
jgi:hypothetical protein